MADNFPSLVSNGVGKPEDLMNHPQVEEAKKAEREKQESEAEALAEAARKAGKKADVGPAELINEEDLDILGNK